MGNINKSIHSEDIDIKEILLRHEHLSGWFSLFFIGKINELSHAEDVSRVMIKKGFKYLSAQHTQLLGPQLLSARHLTFLSSMENGDIP